MSKLESIGWGKDDKEEVIAESTRDEEIPKELQAVNVGLETKEMKRLYRHFENKYPKVEVLPLIVKGITLQKSRFYVLRGITQTEVTDLQDLFARLQDKEVEVFRAKVRDEFLAKLGSDVKEIPDNKVPEFELLANQKWAEQVEGILKNTNQIAINMMCVCYPENHKARIQADLVPPGDVDIIAMAGQTLSGWSQVRTDIDVYEKENEPNPAIKQMYDALTSEDDEE